MNKRSTHHTFLAISSLVLLAACASDSENMRPDEADMSNVRCANGEPLACVEKMGKTVDCTCRSRRDLERLTKGGLRNW